ncbi:MAG: hypothetical protein HQ582_15815 [Planctomycetes bacterium]|nr:hypothetical protein [Planctomycetota bacterium]
MPVIQLEPVVEQPTESTQQTDFPQIDVASSSRPRRIVGHSKWEAGDVRKLAVQIVAGDFAKGEWFGIRTRTGRVGLEGPNGEKLMLSGQLDNIEKLDEKKRKEIKRTAGWAAAGLVTLGPLGMVAGLFMGGNTKDISIIAELKDGYAFMGVTTPEGYMLLRGICLDS